MVIGLIEDGRVQIFESAEKALAEWGAYGPDFMSQVFVLYDEEGQWLKPEFEPGPRRWFGMRKGMDRVRSVHPNSNPVDVDPIGLALSEATELLPNRHFKSLEELRRKFPLEQAGRKSNG